MKKVINHYSPLEYSKDKSCVTSKQSECSEPCTYYEHGWFGFISQSPFYMNKECTLDETKMYASFLKHYEDLFTYTITEGSYYRQTQYKVSITYGDDISDNKEDSIHPLYKVNLTPNQLLFNLLDMDRMLIKKNINIPFLLNSFYPNTSRPVWIVMIRNKQKPCYMVSEEVYHYIESIKYLPFDVYKGDRMIKIGNKKYASSEIITDYNEVIKECYYTLIENKNVEPSDIFKALTGIRYYEPYTPGETEKTEDEYEDEDFDFEPAMDIEYEDRENEDIEFEDLENNAQEMTYVNILQFHFGPLIELKTKEPIFFVNIIKTLCIISLFTILISRNETVLSDETVNNLWNQINPIVLKTYSKREMSNYVYTFIKNVILSIQITDELNKRNKPSKAQLVFVIVSMILLTTVIISIKYLLVINPQSTELRDKVDRYKEQLDAKEKFIEERRQLEERILVSKQHKGDNPGHKTVKDFCEGETCTKYVYDWNKTETETHGQHPTGAERIFEPQMDSLLPPEKSESAGTLELQRAGFTLVDDTTTFGDTQFSQNEMDLEKVAGIGGVYGNYLSGKIHVLPPGLQTPIFIAKLPDGTKVVIDGHHRTGGWQFALSKTDNPISERLQTKFPVRVFEIPKGRTLVQFMDHIGRIKGVQYKNLQGELVYENGNPAFNATSQQKQAASLKARKNAPEIEIPRELNNLKEQAPGLVITIFMIKNSTICKIIDEYFNVTGKFSGFKSMVKSWLYSLFGDLLWDEIKPTQSK